MFKSVGVDVDGVVKTPPLEGIELLGDYRNKGTRRATAFSRAAGGRRRWKRDSASYACRSSPELEGGFQNDVENQNLSHEEFHVGA